MMEDALTFSQGVLFMGEEPLIQVRTLVVLFIAVLAGAAGDTLLARGMKQVGAVSPRGLTDLVIIGFKMFSNRTVWAGILCLSAYFFLFSTALSWDEMSRVVPLTGLSFVVPVIFAHFFLRDQEEVTPLRWIGALFIAFGAMLVGLSSGKRHP